MLPRIDSIDELVAQMRALEAMRPRQSVRVSEAEYQSNNYVLRRGGKQIATVNPAILEHSGPHTFYYCRTYRLSA